MFMQSDEVRRHVFAVLVENRFGVLGRITGLFSARGFNIESLSVAPQGKPRSDSLRRCKTSASDEKFIWIFLRNFLKQY